MTDGTINFFSGVDAFTFYYVSIRVSTLTPRRCSVGFIRKRERTAPSSLETLFVTFSHVPLTFRCFSLRVCVCVWRYKFFGRRCSVTPCTQCWDFPTGWMSLLMITNRMDFLLFVLNVHLRARMRRGMRRMSYIWFLQHVLHAYVWPQRCTQCTLGKKLLLPSFQNQVVEAAECSFTSNSEFNDKQYIQEIYIIYILFALNVKSCIH